MCAGCLGLSLSALLACLARCIAIVVYVNGRIETANAADEPKFSDVLHGSLLWISVADGFFAAELSHAGKLKMGGSACGNPSPKTGFLLARISGDAQFVSVRQQRPKDTARVDDAIWTGGGGSCPRPLAPIGPCARSQLRRCANPFEAPQHVPMQAVS